MLRPPVQNEPTPADLGFAIPAEWEEHQATWLAWPHNPTDWPGKLDTIRWVYGEIARKIAPSETVRMLVNNKAEEKLARGYLRRAGAELRRVQFIVHPTNRGWTRDTGPIFVKRDNQKSVMGQSRRGTNGRGGAHDSVRACTTQRSTLARTESCAPPAVTNDP